MEKEKKKKKKGSYGKVFGFCVVAGGIIALVSMFGFGGGGGWGLFGGNGGSGNGEGNGTNGGTNTEAHAPYTEQGNENETPYEDEPNGDTAYNEPTTQIITVTHDRIYHGDQEITAGELEQIIDELNQPGVTWQLVDYRAYVEPLELVKSILRDNGIDF